jgi:ankyrin repeat protein
MSAESIDPAAPRGPVPEGLEPRPLHQPPNLEQLRKQAKELLVAMRAGETRALGKLDALKLPRDKPALHQAQLIVAREYGFQSWRHLKAYVDSYDPRREGRVGLQFRQWVRNDEWARVGRALKTNPTLANDVWYELEGTALPAMLEAVIATPAGCRSRVVLTLLRYPIKFDVWIAAATDQVDVLAAMLERDPTLREQAGPNGYTPLQWAARGGADAAVRLLVQKGADVGRIDRMTRKVIQRTGQTPSGGWVSYQDCGWRPLHHAAAMCGPDGVRALLDCGANPAAPLTDGRRPIDVAAMLGRDNVVRAFVDAGQRIDIHVAAALGQLDAVQRFVERTPASIQAALDGESRLSPVQIAGLCGHQDLVDWLISRGAAPKPATVIECWGHVRRWMPSKAR